MRRKNDDSREARGREGMIRGAEEPRDRPYRSLPTFSHLIHSSLRSSFIREPKVRRERRVGGTWKRLFWFISSLPSAPLSLRYRFHVPLRALLLSSVVGTERRPARRASRDEWNEERERRRESKRRGDSMTGEDLTGRDSPRRRITLVGSFVHRLSVPLTALMS